MGACFYENRETNRKGTLKAPTHCHVSGEASVFSTCVGLFASCVRRHEGHLNAQTRNWPPYTVRYQVRRQFFHVCGLFASCVRQPEGHLNASNVFDILGAELRYLKSYMQCTFQVWRHFDAVVVCSHRYKKNELVSTRKLNIMQEYN